MTTITNKKIQDAFIKLLYIKPYDKIIVKDISDACEINRNTFYYHYEDIDSVVSDIVKDRFDSVGKKASHMEGFKNQCAYVLKWLLNNKQPILNVYHSFDKKCVDRHVYRMAKLISTKFVEAGYVKRGVDKKKLKTISEFYIALTYGFVLMILDNNIPDDILQSLDDLFDNMGSMIDFSVQSICKSE